MTRRAQKTAAQRRYRAKAKRLGMCGACCVRKPLRGRSRCGSCAARLTRHQDALLAWQAVSVRLPWTEIDSRDQLSRLHDEARAEVAFLHGPFHAGDKARYERSLLVGDALLRRCRDAGLAIEDGLGRVAVKTEEGRRP